MHDHTKAPKTELDTLISRCISEDFSVAQPQHLHISHMLHVVKLRPVSLIQSRFICLHTYILEL